MKTGDITDAFLRALAPSRGGTSPASVPKPPPAPASAKTPARAPARTEKGRSFLSEYDIRKALTPGSRDLTIPRDAIVSPLALEWLALKGIRVIRSS